MARVVTFDENGVSKITDYSDSTYSNDEIKTLLHNNSYRRNLLKSLREKTNGKSLDEISDNTLGYYLDELVKDSKKIHSTITRIEFHSLPLKNFGIKL